MIPEGDLLEICKVPKALDSQPSSFDIFLPPMPALLFINRVYPPDSGATGRVLEHVARGFRDAGWEVTVLVTAGERSSPGSVSQDGVKVVSVASPFSKKSLLARALGYVLMIPSLGWKALLMPRADVVVTMTDPPMLLVIGPFLKIFKGSRLIHWAQDLYPEVAEEAGVFRRGGAVATVVRWISTMAMRFHDGTVAVGRCMAERLVARGIPTERIRVIPNTGVEREIIPRTDRGRSFRDRHALGDAFVVMYSGNMGRAHEFGTVLEAARDLQAGGVKDVLFLFVGSGPGEALLRGEVDRMGLSNVRFLPPQPTASLSESLGAADLHLVTMREGMSGLVVPSKFYGVLAAERPCLYIGPADSEVALVIGSEGVGRVIRCGDAKGLQAAIMEYRDSPSLLTEQGSKGRRILSDPDAVALFVECADSLIERSQS
jgi:hypothetical protein